MSEADWYGLEDFPTIADTSAFDANRNGAPGSEPSSWEPISLAELADEPPVQPTLGDIGIVYPGKRHVFSGPQESAKTLAGYAIALEVIRAEQAMVVLIDFEMGQWDARNRLRELGASPEEMAMIAYVEPSEPATPAAIERLVSLNPKLLLVDAAAGAYDVQGLDDNKRSDVERFTSMYVRPFWRAGIASLVLDHVVKNIEGRGKYAIGSERKVGGADVHLGFEVVSPIKRGGHGLYKIVTHKDRGGFLKRGKLADFELESHPDTHLISWRIVSAEHSDEEVFRPTHLMEKVSRYLQDHGGSSQNAVEKGVTGRREFVRQALERLVIEEFAVETDGPRDAKLFTSLKAFLEARDEWVAPVDNDLAPPRPDLAPGAVIQPRPTSPPPHGGRGVVDVADEGSTSPQEVICRKCQKSFRRGSGNRGDLCGECVADELPF